MTTTGLVSRGCQQFLDDESIDAHLLPHPEANPITEAEGCSSTDLWRAAPGETLIISSEVSPDIVGRAYGGCTH